MAQDLDTRDAVPAAIRARHALEFEMTWLGVSKSEPELMRAVERFFPTKCPWGDAVQAAGLPLSTTLSKHIE